MMRVALVLLLAIGVLCETSQPNSVGILLKYEKGNGKDLKAYIDHFTDPGCNSIMEFNVIISHEAAQEAATIEQEYLQYQAIIPVNFYYANEKEADYRFRIPKTSQAELYYVSSIFINEEMCQDIEEYVELANKRMYGGLFGMIGELESATSIQVDLRRKEQEIFYYDKIPGTHYCLVEDIRLIPRHILELSQSSIKEISQMANNLKPYCEEIFLNFVSSHFYPELRPLAFNFPTTVNVALDEANEYEQKNFCIRKFIDILGYLPVYYQRKEFTRTIWTNPNLSKVIELKKQQLLMAISKNTQHSLRMLPESSRISPSTAPAQTWFESLLLNTLWSAIAILSVGILFYLSKTMIIEAKLRRLPVRSQ